MQSKIVARHIIRIAKLAIILAIPTAAMAIAQERTYTDPDLKQLPQQQSPVHIQEYQEPTYQPPAAQQLPFQTPQQTQPSVPAWPLQIEKLFAREISITFIITGPLLAALSQVFLAIRETAINTRTSLSSNQSPYQILYWISTGLLYVGILETAAGLILFVKTF